MNSLKYVCSFLPHKRDKAAEYANLMCRVKWNGSRSIVSLNVGYLINPDKWDSRTMYCEKRSVHGPLHLPAQRINNEINRFREAADKVFDNYARTDVWPTAEMVRRDLRAELGLESPQYARMAQAFDLFVRESSATQGWSLATVRKMATVKKHLSEFPPLSTFDGFTTANFTGYLEYLRNGLGHNDVTVHRQIGYLKWFCSWAHKKKYLLCDDYLSFTPKLKRPEKPVVFLTWPELMKVWAYDDPEGRKALNDARDLFLFSCFTSLRYSDVVALRWSQVKSDRIEVVQKKTAKAVTIALNKWSDEIILRHLDEDNGDDRVFPPMPNQVVNRYLKRIGEAVGLDELVTLTEYRGAERIDTTYKKFGLLTMHCGRRTFICNALQMGITPTEVMAWTGHSDYRAMKPYIAVSGNALARSMKKFDER